MLNKLEKTRDVKGRFVPSVSRGSLSQEVRQKIGAANTGVRNGMYRGGKPHCRVCDKELWWGSTHCKKHAIKPKPSEDTRKKMSALATSRFKDETKHPNWKGAAVGYAPLHRWVRKHLGIPDHCAICGRGDARRFEWANISHEYKRELGDWMSLCKPCHMRYDNVGEKVWESRRKHA